MILNAAGVPMAGSDQKQAIERAQGIMSITLQAAGLARADGSDLVNVSINLILHVFGNMPQETEEKFIQEVSFNVQQALREVKKAKAAHRAQQAQINGAIRDAIN